MRAYQTIRFTEGPDCGDLGAEGRKSSVGNIRTKGGDYRNGSRNVRSKKATRRTLKRADRARSLRIEME